MFTSNESSILLGKADMANLSPRAEQIKNLGKRVRKPTGMFTVNECLISTCIAGMTNLSLLGLKELRTMVARYSNSLVRSLAMSSRFPKC